MINYILQVILFQALFLAVYDFFLQKETFFKGNRIYLLITPLLSFLIPLLKSESIQKTIPQEYTTQLPTVFINPEAYIVATSSNEASIDYLAIFYYLGIIIFSILFLTRLYKLIKLIYSNEVIKEDIYSLVILRTKQSAFSFFNYIFINKQLLKNKELDVVKHELVHCREKHSIDLLIFELLKIVMWFNPVIYIYQKRITILHEYISDAEVVKETDKKTYFNKLLAETFSVENISFTNQFFKHSLIKKRIVMITKEKSKKMKQLKYLLIIPLLFGMLIYSSCSNDVQSDIENAEKAFKEENIPSEGRYFISGNGIVWFFGTHLVGEVIPPEEYTEQDKEIIYEFLTAPNKKIDKSVVIDENNDRVYFIKTKSTPKKDDDSISFSKIEEVPIFPGCEGTEEELRQCLQDSITKHVNKNFNSKLASSLSLSPGVKRIFVMFKINDEGNITDVKARAPHMALQEEAVRVVNLLPKMIPGKHESVNVGVKYSLPIAFKVEGDEETKDSELKRDDIPFAIVDETPIYPGCEGDEVTKRKCLTENITKFVNKNFDTSLSKSLNLSPGVKRFFVMFKIDKEGNITDVKARAPHKTLEEEAIRVINSLPKMIPGKSKGENVNVQYSLPIAFKVEGDEMIDSASTLPKDPIYMLDGKEISKSELEKMTPDNIESINILTGEKAIEKYGEKVKNGVMEITLKK